MKVGKITTKLRDAVPVCLMVEGKEEKTVQEHRPAVYNYQVYILNWPRRNKAQA